MLAYCLETTIKLEEICRLLQDGGVKKYIKHSLESDSSGEHWLTFRHVGGADHQRQESWNFAKVVETTTSVIKNHPLLAGQC